MTIQEQYVELQKYRKKQSADVLNNKKRTAWKFFRNYTNVSNLEKIYHQILIYILLH